MSKAAEPRASHDTCVARVPCLKRKVIHLKAAQIERVCNAARRIVVDQLVRLDTLRRELIDCIQTSQQG